VISDCARDSAKICARLLNCKSLRFKQERKQSCNTSIVMEAQKVSVHWRAFSELCSESEIPTALAVCIPSPTAVNVSISITGHCGPPPTSSSYPSRNG